MQTFSIISFYAEMKKNYILFFREIHISYLREIFERNERDRVSERERVHFRNANM